MERRVDLYVWRDQRIIADPDDVVVQKCAVHVDLAVVAQEYIVAVIDVKRRRDPYISAETAQ